MLNIIITIFIGLLLQMMWQSLLFMVSYIPLRTYAGGYHAGTQLRCFWYSILLILVVLLAIKFIPWTNFIILGLALVSGTVIYLLAPMEDENKPLSKSEVKVYKNRARVILLLELVSIFILITNNMYAEGVCVLLSILALSIMLFMGKHLKKSEKMRRFGNF
jgi:accessory gene regulator B